MNRLDQLEHLANQFHEQHPDVWCLFTKFTKDRISKGFGHYSAKAIWERIRWETAAPADGWRLGFKLNNNFHAIYARWFMERYPKHNGFFRTRARPSELAPPATKHELQPRDF